MEERRRYYRINDDLTLKYRVIDESRFESEVQQTKLAFVRHTEIDKGLQLLDEEFEQLCVNLENNHPLVAEALFLLNKKISVLAKLASFDPATELDDMQSRAVNLSGCGIGFYTEEMLQEDTALAIDMVLSPENTYLTLFGRVVYSNTDTEGHYFVAVDFENMDETDQEKIIQHVIKKQSLDLKRSA